MRATLTSRIASPVELDATLTAARFRLGHANEIMSFFPHAAAYLRSVENDGECFSLDSEASSLDTADVVVPIRSATCACVKPASLRASSNARSAVNSSSSASYSALMTGSESKRAVSSAVCRTGTYRSSFARAGRALAITLYLFHSPTGDTQFVFRRFLHLLDERMQDDEFVSNLYAIKHASDTFTTSRAQFKQSCPHCARMWHP